ncbi:protein kinase domain-containing protein [Pseudanabaena sp. PCC 6802]|uniref:protein kinase domain-containing protein n=1 Tax=Pseudanabaena sp. PCC 6802 TaxID=118173 RepID=UPI00034DD6B7|nr:protein kinase [Pseudanabaena sp. PCC 6802]
MSSSHRSDTWLGRLVGDRDRYRLEEHLGGGGMGDVFLATDTLLGKQVALKLLKGALVDVEGFGKRFSREVALCAALKSDHIVQVSDYGMTVNGEPFYVMEYLEGETLGQRLAQQQRLSPQEAIGIIIQVCRGLQVAHEGVNVWKKQVVASTKSRIVHRDLKPENIYLVPTVLGELVKIIDFGIAKIYSEQQQQVQETNLSYSNQFLGTFRYASPEQWENRKELDGRSDIYSLGIIFYEMLSGTDPFHSKTTQTDLASIVFWATAHTKQPPKPLRSQPGCAYISPEIEAVVMRCLEKSPDRRFATVTELSRAIVQAASDSNLPLNISIPPPALQDASIPTEVGANLETEMGRFGTPALDSSFSETIASAHIPLSVTEPTQNAFPSEPLASETTQGGKPTPGGRNSLLKVVAGTGIVGILASVSYVYWQGLGNSSNRGSSNIAILEDIKTLKSQSKYEECIAKATSATSSAADTSINPDLQSILNQCQLERAKQFAIEQKFDLALARIAQIPAHSSSYAESQQLVRQWSVKAIALAAPRFQNGDLNGAIALLNAIPKTSPGYAKAQTAIANWKKEWQTAELNFKAAQSALKNNNPQAVLDATNKIPKIAFWQKKAKPIADDANARLAKINQPAIVEPSNPATDPAPVYIAPSRIPEAPTSVQPEAPAVQAPPEPNPVYTVPPNQNLGEEQPSSNKKDEGI